MTASAPAHPRSPLPVTALEQRVQRYFELSLFAMIVTGFVSLAGTGKLDEWSLLAGLGALGLRAWGFSTGHNLVLTDKTTSQLTVLYAAFYVADYFVVSASFVTATVHLVLFIMVVKMFSVQRSRDHLYLAIISFMMVLSSSILTVDSFFLAAFFVFLLLTISTFISMEMRRSFEAVRAVEARAQEISADESAGLDAYRSGSVAALDTEAGQAPQRLSRSLSTTAASLLVAIAVGATVIFFVLPRTSAGYLTRFAAQNQYVSGFSDEVRLGDIGRIQQSDSVVMHVQFTNPADVPVDLKWRGVSLSFFNGKSWSKRTSNYLLTNPLDRSLRLDSPQIAQRIFGADRLPLEFANRTLEYRVFLQPIGTNVFFLPPVPLRLGTEFRLFNVDNTGAVLLLDSGRQIRSYTGASALLLPSQEIRRSTVWEFPEPISAVYLQQPPLDTRVAVLAAEITRNGNSVYEKAQLLELYLRTKFAYTLELEAGPAGAGGDTDPLAHFLFTRRQGHCEYFASAMALMLRTQGIPTRIVNGFRNGELNDITGSYVVRARDAHAWVEVYVPGFGWTTFDPTPAATLEPKTTWSRMMLYMDAMREFWNEWVINYDFGRQNQLGESTASRTRTFFDESRIWMRNQYDKLLESARQAKASATADPERVGKRGVLIVASLLLLFNLRRMVRYVRMARTARRPSAAPRAAASIWYERLTRLLRRRGFEKASSQTPQEFLETIGNPKVQGSVAHFTEHYERARFGGSPEDAGRLPELYEEVELTLRK